MSVLLSCLTGILLLIVHLYVMVGAVSVELDLEIVPVNDSNCIGGPEIGLTNTTVLLQHRELGTDHDSTLEWRFLADIDPNKGLEERLTVDIENNGSTPAGVQLRLLQLEHGGGVCNCWQVDRAILTLSNEMEINITESDFCSVSELDSRDQNKFCGGYAGKVRGLVTKVFMLNSSMGGCPGDTSNTILCTKGEPVTVSCSDVTPRM